MKIVVTGSSSGIGLQMAKHRRALGDKVFGLSRSTGCDVTDKEDMRYWRSTLGSEPFDALICCAGIMEGSLAEVVATNLFGVHNCLETVPAPRIVCFSGGGAPVPLKGHLAYSVSKTAVVALVQSYALQHPEVIINAIAPGSLLSKMNPEGSDEYGLMLACVDYLISDECKYSGKLISVQRDNWRDERLVIDPNFHTIRRT